MSTFSHPANVSLQAVLHLVQRYSDQVPQLDELLHEASAAFASPLPADTRVFQLLTVAARACDLVSTELGFFVSLSDILPVSVSN